jgi:hypothetical protein
MQTSDWNQKINRARQVEHHLADWIRKKFDPEAKMPAQYTPHYDIESPVLGNIEVKEDRLAHKTDMYAFEYSNFEGEDSGYLGTKAKTFVIVDQETVIMVATESLNYILRNSTQKRKSKMGYRVKDDKTCFGWLIPRTEIIYSPYAQVYEHWASI